MHANASTKAREGGDTSKNGHSSTLGVIPYAEFMFFYAT